MWNNTKFNPMLNNPMNIPFKSNNLFNNQFFNGFNQMNNPMCFNNNFNNPFYNNVMSSNLAMNQMMMNQNKIMFNMIQYNNQIRKNNLIYKMEQILNQNDKPINNNIETEEERQKREEAEKISMALNDVGNEPHNQKQNFENYHNTQNLNYVEVDPTFLEEMNSDQELMELFCGRGHKIDGKWAHGENRGGKPYNPPDGWIGFGLNVLNKYDNGNNDWLACDGRAGEWCVAYHGACRGNSSEQIKQIIKPILQYNLRPGSGQGYSGSNDIFHPGHTVGVGVYCSPNISIANGYAGTIDVRGFKYQVAFMLRVKPDKIRAGSNDIWVLNAGNGDFSEIRPYRFLIKKC